MGLRVVVLRREVGFAREVGAHRTTARSVHNVLAPQQRKSLRSRSNRPVQEIGTAQLRRRRAGLDETGRAQLRRVSYPDVMARRTGLADNTESANLWPSDGWDGRGARLNLGRVRGQLDAGIVRVHLQLAGC